jgi:putative transposase
MQKRRFSEAKIVQILREAEAGTAVEELCRKYGMSDASFYIWRQKYGGMEVSGVKRLKNLA